MIELKVLVDDIDYDSLAEFLIPILVGHLREEKSGILGSVLSQNPDMATSMARTMLNKLSHEKKDELLIQLLTKNRDKLLRTGQNALTTHQIHARVCDISARVVD